MANYLLLHADTISDVVLLLQEFLTSSRSTQDGLLSMEQQLTNELQSYLAEPILKQSDVNVISSADPFKWWAVNCGRFPNVARVSRMYLAIPATSVASERLFSAAGLTVGNRRCSLKPDHVEQIVSLHQNLR
jgi:hypothetical protein